MAAQRRKLWGELAKELAAFILVAACIVLLWKDNLLLSLVMLVIGLAGLILWHERYDVTFFLAIAVLGSVAEVVFVGAGVWRYANPAFLGIPLWFPLAFGTSGLIGERLARTITELQSG